MTIIDEVAAKLRGAQRALRKAQKVHEENAEAAAASRREVSRCEARVAELERALSLLRNGLKPPVVETGSGNVTPLKPR